MDLATMRNTAAPVMVSLDVTSNCNLRCVHCFNDSGNEAPIADLSPDKKLEIARQVADLHPHNVCLCGGETLCCPNLLEICDVLAPNVGKLSMVSNGFIMTEAVARKLKEHGLSLVQISIDGAFAWQHDSFRGVKGSFEKATQAVRNLIAAGITTVDTSLVPNKLNHRSMEAYVRLCIELGVHEIRMMPFLPSGRGRSIGRNMMLSSEEYFAFCRDIQRLSKEYAGRIHLQWGDPIDHMRRMPANAELGLHSYSMEIKTDGSLSISSYLPVMAGNVTKHTPREYWDAGYRLIWADKRYTQYIDKIRNIYDLEDFEPAPYSGEVIMMDLLEDTL